MANPAPGPRNTRASLEEIARAREPESETLEFKIGNEDDSVFAKGVAALASANGGELILGAGTERDKSTNRDRWSAWVRETPFNEKKLREALARFLAQRELADMVTFNPFEMETAGGKRFVLVVTVPPWPQGPVAIVSHGDPQQASYKFPIRSGAHTRYIALEEAMRRTDVQIRSMYIRLKEYAAALPPSVMAVAIRSPTIVRTLSVTYPYTPPPEFAYDGELDEIEFDHVRLRMSPPLTSPATRPVQFSRLPVVLPLALIDAAWLENQSAHSPDAKLLCLMLSATLECNGKRWTLSRRFIAENGAV